MNNPFRETLEDLLVIWYHWMAADRPQLGFGRCSPMFRDTPGQRGNIDDDHDVVSARLRVTKAKAVDHYIDMLPKWQHRVAVELHVANRVGPKVWSNCRMTPEQMAEYWQEAREMLREDFEEGGLLEEGDDIRLESAAVAIPLNPQ